MKYRTCIIFILALVYLNVVSTMDAQSLYTRMSAKMDSIRERTRILKMQDEAQKKEQGNSILLEPMYDEKTMTELKSGERSARLKRINEEIAEFNYIEFTNPEDSSKVGIKDCNGVEIIPAIYEHINFMYENKKYVGFYTCRYKDVIGEKRIDVFGLNGVRLFSINNKVDIFTIEPKVTSDGHLFFIPNAFIDFETRSGIINLNGELIYPIDIITFQCDIIYDADEGAFFAIHKNDLPIEERYQILKEESNKNDYNNKTGRKKLLNIKLINTELENQLAIIGKEAKEKSDFVKNNPPIFEIVHNESNGFCWIELSKGYGSSKRKGATTIQGDTIIPLTWDIDEIKYKKITHNMGYFEIKKGENVGLTSLKGNIIIPIEYNTIRFNSIDKIGGLFIGISLIDKSSIHDMNGNEIVRDMDDVIYIEPSKGDIGYLLAKRDDCFGAYDIYGNCIVPLGAKGNRLYYGKKGFYFANDREYLGIQIDEFGAADYSLKHNWDRQKREREEERRRKKEQRRTFWTNLGNTLAQSALGYLGMQSQTMMPMTGVYNTYSTPSFSSNQNIGPLAQQMSQPGYFNNVYQELMFTSMAQVQQQEMWEYNQAHQGALAMGKDLTLDEWRLQQGAALMALKDQGIDLVAEQHERNRQNNREWRESLSQDSKDRIQRIKDYSQMKYGISSSSSSSSSTNRKSGQLSHSTSQGNNASNYNTTSYPQTSTSRNNNSVSNANTQTKPNDSHQQYKNGNKNVSSSDYTYIQRVTLYRQDGSSFRVAKQNAELYEKGAAEYIKIGGTFFPAQPPGKVTEYRKRIVYGGVGLYYN